jgi:integrase
VTQHDLLDGFIGALSQRVEAGQLALRTLNRYRSALAHYQAFLSSQNKLNRAIPPAMIDQAFAYAFMTFLRSRKVAPNGHPNTPTRLISDPGYVVDVVRAMFEWARDPRRGGLLSPQFNNPFLDQTLRRRRPLQNMEGEPDITVQMAAQFIRTCDDYQKTLFLPMVLYGLRASEPIMLFHENIESEWIKVPCIEGLDYFTKGRRDKRLPLLDCIRHLWECGAVRRGLVLLRRSVQEGRERPPLLGKSLPELIEVYHHRLGEGPLTTKEREQIRDGVIRDAGGLDYDRIQREYRCLARQLKWPQAATLKDFRHLFSTAMANGGMPEHERRFLLGHAPSKDAIARYTHLNKIAQHYLEAVQREFHLILKAAHPGGGGDRTLR